MVAARWRSGRRAASLLADTGDAFERIVAAAIPAFFNVPDDSNEFDGRSNSRGPEPEALAVGSIGGRSYVFVGLERVGGVMVYDITVPRHPHFEQYINNRNFAVDPATRLREGQAADRPPVRLSAT